jgi:hypothetical protein
MKQRIFIFQLLAILANSELAGLIDDIIILGFR